MPERGRRQDDVAIREKEVLPFRLLGPFPERVVLPEPAGREVADLDEAAKLAPSEPVVWTNGVNVSAAGSELSKREGNASAWDAGAVSTRGIVSMDGYVELTASETTTHRMIGLSRGDTNQGYPDIDFALYLAYFPKLLAGPIERPARFLSALEADRRVAGSS